jgi:hypothetical protein
MRTYVLTPEQSSQVKEIGYDPQKCELSVVFRNSPTFRYHYPGVAPGDVTEVMFGGSVGSNMRRVIITPWGKNFTKEEVVAVPEPKVYDFVNVIFDGPPSHESGRFVECEDMEGKSVNVGEWIDLGNGLWSLRIPLKAMEVAAP